MIVNKLNAKAHADMLATLDADELVIEFSKEMNAISEHHRCALGVMQCPVPDIYQNAWRIFWAALSYVD